MASSRDKVLPLAQVQRWNAKFVSVQCPFCTKIHTHGFGGSYRSDHRAPHCNYKTNPYFPPYRFAYPFSVREGTVAYEIDKSAGCFVALGAKAIEPEEGSLERALGDLNLGLNRFSESKSWDQATERIAIGMEDETFRRLHEVFGGEDTFNYPKEVRSSCEPDVDVWRLRVREGVSTH